MTATPPPGRGVDRAAHLPTPIVDRLCDLRWRLRDCDADWVIGGSVAAALQGVPVSPVDIDVETDAAGALVIAELIGGEVIRPVRESTAGNVRSHFGIRRFGTAVVEVIGDLRIRPATGDGVAASGEPLSHSPEWTPPLVISRVRVWVSFRGAGLPVLSLQALRQRYLDLGRQDRAVAVHTCLRRAGDTDVPEAGSPQAGTRG